MGWFFKDNDVDRGSDRWGTARHEAGHVVAARRKGGRARAKLVDDRKGFFTGTLPSRASDVDEAVVLLAGRAAGGARHGGATDRANAKRLLSGTGVSVGQAEAQARRLVAQNRAEIDREADQLYRNGRI